MVNITCSTGAGAPGGGIINMHYWRSQGVGYVYVAAGGPQMQMMTQTGAAEQQGHQTAVISAVVIVGRVSKPTAPERRVANDVNVSR
jgi:hypothetical protein